MGNVTSLNSDGLTTKDIIVITVTVVIIIIIFITVANMYRAHNFSYNINALHVSFYFQLD